MKRTFTTLIAILFLSVGAIYAQNQSNEEGISVGIRAGAGFQNINGKDQDGFELKNKMKPGFHGGINIEIPVAPEFYIQPGLLYSTKGGNIMDVNTGQISHSINLNYLELPVNFIYKPELGNGHLITGFGPYAGYAVSGNMKTDGDKVPVQFSGSTADGEGVFRRLDMGANMMAGYEFNNGFSLQLNTQWGIGKITPTNEAVPIDRSISKNTGFGISAGFRF